MACFFFHAHVRPEKYYFQNYKTDCFFTGTITLKCEEQVAAVSRDKQEEHLRPRNSRDTSSLKMKESYLSQYPGAINGRVTKKLSQDFC